MKKPCIETFAVLVLAQPLSVMGAPVVARKNLK
jgi:hypothetical protein